MEWLVRTNASCVYAQCNPARTSKTKTHRATLIVRVYELLAHLEVVLEQVKLDVPVFLHQRELVRTV
jgi:hypothetical protein